jgi:hypothetical protein
MKQHGQNSDKILVGDFENVSKRTNKKDKCLKVRLLSK